MVYENLGTAKDNMKSAIHNWYKFTAGFSYKFVESIILDSISKPSCIYEPFAGCGTTLVEAQKQGICSIGNESQKLMCDVINAKLNWEIETDVCLKLLEKLKISFDDGVQNVDTAYHELLRTLYDPKSLGELYSLRDIIGHIPNETYRLFFNLALSQVLHKVSLYPIAVPYISRSKRNSSPGHVWDRFSDAIVSMLSDLESLPHRNRLASVFQMDSRKQNPLVFESSCDLCITSPPYLNNLDYGEVSKVHTHFFEITKDWHDITEKIRRELVTGATTHYKDCDFQLAEFRRTPFAQNNVSVYQDLEELFLKIEHNASLRKGKKSFHIMMMHYFEDMYNVLIEMRRVLKPGSRAYLILGDSAPYGVYVPTTQYLGEIAQSVGFKEYHIYKIRDRGTKWNIKTRHNISLSENILVLN